MATSYTSLLGFALPVTGELSGTWGDVVNNSITSLVEDSIAGSVTASVAGGDWTLTTTGSGVANQARAAILIPTGSPGVSRNIIAPSQSKAYIVDNKSDAAVVVKGAATTGATVAASTTALVAWNGTDFVLVSQNLSNAVGTLPVSKGGTGATTLTGVLKGNGTSAVTASNVNLTSEVTGTLPIANGGTGLATTPSNGQLDIGNGSGFTRATLTAGSNVTITNGPGSITIASTAAGVGTVTSVGGTGTVNGITLTGTVTSSGNLTLGGSLSGVNLASQVTGTLPVASGGTGATTLTGLVKGSGTSAFTAATANTDYLVPALANTAVTGFKTATFNSQPVIATTSGSITVDWTNAQNQFQTEPTGTITYTFTAPPGPCHLQLLINSDGTSTAQTINWPGSVVFLNTTWAGANNKKSIINFWYDGSTYFAVGSNQV